jgi:NADH-quinone oxidoreductase subunit M
VILAAIYMLWAYERVFTGPVTDEANSSVADVGLREVALLAPLVALILLLGIYPKVALDVIEPSTQAVLDRVEAATDYEVPAPGRFADVIGVGE